MISDLIGSVADTANKAVVDDAKKDVDKLKDLLAGPKRAPTDVEKEKAKFTRGIDLSTPGGDIPTVPARPTDAKAGGDAAPANVQLGTLIEFIHFGRVHHDAARTFHAANPTDDMKSFDPKTTVPGRAVYYRAALEREAIVLAALAKCVSSALAEKEKDEGNLGDLMKAAADLLGGQGGTATSASSADMQPFVDKIGKSWDKINAPDIKYTELHDAGIKLHEVRANLAAYLMEQLAKPPKDAAAPKGILENLPLVGELPLPGPIGQIVTMFRKVGGKLHDVSDSLIFGLTVAMQPAIESAAHELSLDVIKEGRTLIYPVWFEPALVEQDAKKQPFSDMGENNKDPLGGDLQKIGVAQAVNSAVDNAIDGVNKGINSAAEKPLEIVDFLSKPVKPAPGNRYLDAAFQAATGEKSMLGGSEKLGEIAVAAFFSAITDDVPDFLHGFIEDFVGYVFAVCVEFLRAVYRVLCGLAPTDTVSTDELVAAGSTHVLTHLVDFLIEKIGLDKLIEKLSIPIPAPPSFLPTGVNWPQGNLSAGPIAEELKKLLIDKASPYLKPVVEFAMSGLATRLNAQRTWAGGTAMTMEAHLGQLPTELALLFRNLFKPLWDFLNDTCMSVISDGVGKALGPAAKALGVAGDAVGTASNFIADAQKKAQQAQAYAKNVEDKAGQLIDKLSSVQVGIGDTGDLGDISDAAGALKNAVTSNPFTDGPGDAADAAKPGAGFPSDRKNQGKGIEIKPDEVEEVSKTDQWDTAKVEGEDSAKDPAGDDGASSDSGSSDAATGGAP